MMKHFSTRIIGIASCLGIALMPQSVNADELKPKTAKFDIFQVLHNSSWSVDMDTPIFGLGEVANYKCDAPMQFELNKAEMVLNYKMGKNEPGKAVIFKEWSNDEDHQGIIIQYENEKRLDFHGDPMVWLLTMPDKDRFYWTWYNPHTGATFGNTRMRNRCASDSS